VRTLCHASFLERYVQLGIENQIPVMMPAGVRSISSRSQGTLSSRSLKKKANIGPEWLSRNHT
jgi:hypothetical protein